MEKEVAVLIPAYNPDKKMTELVKTLSTEYEHIIIVNDGCSEEFKPMFEEVKDLAVIVNHDVNKGKGRALKTGFQYILDNLSELKAVITVDADGQHTPEDTAACIKLSRENGFRPVFGCRDFYSDASIPARSKFGNRTTSNLLKTFCKISLSDTQTGLRVLPVDILNDLIETKGDRYEYEMNMIFTLHDIDRMWIECPISVIYIEDNESSHFNPVKDSIKIYKVFFAYIFSGKKKKKRS